MKKHLLSVVLTILTAGLFYACSNEEMSSENIADGSMVNVSFNANLSQAPLTRAVAGETNGTEAKTLTVAVYNSSNEEIAILRQVKENAFDSSLGTTVNLQLMKGQTYSIVFWAQNPNATAGAVTFNPATGKVNVDYSKIKANDETLDAFTAHVSDLKVTGEMNQGVTLKRPWAQLNYGSTDFDWEVAAAAGITAAKSKVTVNNVFAELDAITGKVVPASVTKAEVVLAANTLPKGALRVDGVAYHNIGLNYLLVGDQGEKSLIKADLEVQKADGSVINALTFSNVPVQRNYRTNILGNLLTSQVSFNITIDPLYDGDRALNDQVHVEGIPDDDDATPNPTVPSQDINTVIPNFSYTVSQENNWTVIRLDMTGVKDPFTNDWLRLYGPNNTKQNLWISLDGKPKGFSIYNTIDEAGNQTNPKIDLVFLVDNSTSMSEEANAIYNDIINWSMQLSKTLDVRFGCVGYGGFVSGAINLTTAEALKSYLEQKSWRSNVSGIWRTRGFAGADAQALYEASLDPDRRVVSSRYVYTNNADPDANECGVMALRYANDLFSFRNGANRVYVNLTDEPNQPGGKANLYSTTWVKENWTATQGTIHTVYSDRSSWANSYKQYVDRNYPWDLSLYTDGTMLFTNSNFIDNNGKQVHLSDLPVTGALKNSYIIRFSNVEEVFDGQPHILRMTVKSNSENGEIIADKENPIIFEK
jgi:hypothetical protein